jgi:hypothetical protein
MEPDPNLWLWIIGAAVVSGLLCAWITALFYRARLRRCSKQTWNQARLFYTRRAASHFIR